MFKHKKSVLLQRFQSVDVTVDVDASELNATGYARNNVRIVAFADILATLIVIVDFTVAASETEIQHAYKLVEREHVFVVVTFTFVAFVTLGLILTFFLIKATNLKTRREAALKKAKWWLYYSYFLQILLPVLITVAALYGRKNEFGVIAVGGTFFVVRIAFIIVVFRFVKMLKMGVLGLVTVAPAPYPPPPPPEQEDVEDGKVTL